MTRYNDNVNGFTDLSEHSYLTPPHVVVRAADLVNRKIRDDADLFNEHGITRKVLYEASDGTRYYLELVPYVHPSATAITIGAITESGEVRTYTPSEEGRLITETGVLIPSVSHPLPAIDVAGMLLTDYFEQFTDNLKEQEHYRVVDIEEGDFLWLVRNGEVELDASGAVTDGDILVSSSTVDGEVESAPVIIDVATLRENIVGQPNHFGLARAAETTVAAGLVAAHLELPRRHTR